MNIHHSFDISLAASLKSVELAILIHHFQYWIQYNKNSKRNSHDGRTWMYQTLKEISDHFPYWSHKQIERFINKLIECNILIKGNFNKSPYDRTVWYAFKDEEKFLTHFSKFEENSLNESEIPISRNREIEIQKSGNQNLEIGIPIPNTKTNTKTKDICASKADAKKFSVSTKKDPSLTPIQKQRLISDFGESQTTEAIKFLEDWKESKAQVDPKALKLHTDYHRIRKWVIPSLQKEKKQDPVKKCDLIKSKLEANFKNHEINNGYFISWNDYQIEIQSQSGYQLFLLKFSELGFWDQLMNAFRKYKIDFKAS